MKQNLQILSIKNIESGAVDTRDDKLRYFILSVAWRFMRWEFDNEPGNNIITEKEIDEISRNLEKWRLILYQENLEDTREVQRFFILSDKIKELNEHPTNLFNSVSPYFWTRDNRDELKYGTFFSEGSTYNFSNHAMGTYKIYETI